MVTGLRSLFFLIAGFYALSLGRYALAGRRARARAGSAPLIPAPAGGVRSPGPV
jgi:hypothetical protein